jgi:plasmid maintenance system antidote protein VapI
MLDFEMGILSEKLQETFSLSARKLAHFLGIAPFTVCRYLTEVLEVKYQHL